MKCEGGADRDLPEVTSNLELREYGPRVGHSVVANQQLRRTQWNYSQHDH